MTDVIRIRDLSVETRIGVTPEERAMPRSVVVNVDMVVDTRRAGVSDDLADTADYSAAIEAIAQMVGGAESRLIEHLAERIAALIVRMNGVNGVTVEVVKAPVPVDQDVGSVSVVIER